MPLLLLLELLPEEALPPEQPPNRAADATAAEPMPRHFKNMRRDTIQNIVDRLEAQGVAIVEGTH